MRGALERLLDSDRTILFASLFSLALGLFFIFVWSPLPWGWEGIDFYHDRAIRLVAGEPFDTTDVPWGYAYFLALFYAIFGIHAWVPLVAQAILNAFVPVLLFRLVQPLAGHRIAALAALICGFLSFNTVYASTQSTDSVSTVLFLAALVVGMEARRSGRWGLFAIAGALSGLVPQFRPNLLLFPPAIGALYLLESPRVRRKLGFVAIYIGAFAIVLAPWVIRNYRLMHVFLPTSTHGGVQLWYGTLQVGPYLESRADNPRKEFQGGNFDYTSLTSEPLIAVIDPPICQGTRASEVTLNFWTDRDATVRQLSGASIGHELLQFVIPAQPDPTTVYYDLESRWSGSPEPVITPLDGRNRPGVYFVSADHFGDLDRRDDVFDLFDLIRILRTLAWQETPSRPGIQDVDGDGRVTDQDVHRAVTLLADAWGERTPAGVREIAARDTAVRLVLTDGSWLQVPRAWTGRATDIDLDGELAGVLVHARLRRTDMQGRLRSNTCGGIEFDGLNNVFYRRELHEMRRYTALALDNIRRDPWAYAVSVAYRAVRLFVINGSDALQRTQQFENSGVVYTTGTALSAVYLLLFIGGAVWAWKYRPALRPLLLPIAYIPATISFVLTNMRYTITVQPLMFVFVAAAIVAVVRLDSAGASKDAPLRT
jgi:hypothetical protein